MDSLPFANTAKGDKELEVVHKFVFTLNAVCFRFYFSLVAQKVKNLPAIQETGFDPWLRKIPQRKKWQLTPIFLPGEVHGQRSLVGFSPWGRKELDTTEQLAHIYHSQIFYIEYRFDFLNLFLTFFFFPLKKFLSKKFLFLCEGKSS